MISILLTLLFLWLLFKAVKLVLKMSWGIVKLLALVLIVLSLPTLAGCLLTMGGLLLLLPLGLILAVLLLIKLCHR